MPSPLKYWLKRLVHLAIRRRHTVKQNLKLGSEHVSETDIVASSRGGKKKGKEIAHVKF